MNKEKLDSTLIELKKDLMKLQSQLSTGTNLESPGKVRQIKKNIARILTYKKIPREEKTKTK